MTKNVSPWKAYSHREGLFSGSHTFRYRETKGVREWQKLITRSFDIDGASVDQAVRSLRAVAADLVDARINIDNPFEEQGSTTIIGYAELLDEEDIAIVEAWFDTDNAAAQANELKWAETQLRRIRETHPELLDK